MRRKTAIKKFMYAINRAVRKEEDEMKKREERKYNTE